MPTKRTEFQSDVSQLVHKYREEGLDADAVCDVLRLQAEVVALTDNDG